MLSVFHKLQSPPPGILSISRSTQPSPDTWCSTFVVHLFLVIDSSCMFISPILCLAPESPKRLSAQLKKIYRWNLLLSMLPSFMSTLFRMQSWSPCKLKPKLLSSLFQRMLKPPVKRRKNALKDDKADIFRVHDRQNKKRGMFHRGNP